jgi:hypothetical protein
MAGKEVPMTDSAKIVTFELSQRETDYAALFNALKIYPKWTCVCESAWIVITGDTCAVIKDSLKKYLHKDDRLFVADLGRLAAWYNLKCDSQWLKENL